MPSTLIQLRARVRERARVSTRDPLAPDALVNRYVNQAVGSFLSAQPNGWWWQYVECTIQNLNVDQPLWKVELETPDPTRLIRKVSTVFVSLDGDYWLPIDARERMDQIRLAGGRTVADGIPLSWSPIAVPSSLSVNRPHLGIVFDPPLPAFAWVRYIVVVGPADLTADADVLTAVPAMLTDAIVERAAVSLIRQMRPAGRTKKRTLIDLETAIKAADSWLHDARVYFSAPTAGAGYATQQIRR